MKIALIAGGVLVAAAVVVLALVWGRPYVLEIEQSRLQQAIDGKLPASKTYLGVVGVKVTDARVILQEGSDEIGLDVGVHVGVPVVATAEGRATLAGKIRYVPEEGAFYVTDPKVNALKVDRLPEVWVERTRMAIELVMAEVLREKPVYTLQSTDLRQAATKLLLKDVRVVGGKLRVTLGIGG